MRNHGVAGLVAAFALMGGCVSHAPTQEDQEQQKKTAILKEGTEVKLILLKQLESGGIPVGEQAPFMVVEDVKDDEDNVMIPCGTIAYGEGTGGHQPACAAVGRHRENLRSRW